MRKSQRLGVLLLVGGVIACGLPGSPVGADGTVMAATTAPATQEKPDKPAKSKAGVKKEKLKVAKPSKSRRANAPPKGAKRSNALTFSKSLKWKTDPKTHSVFAIGPGKQLWFMDPSTGWPYTIDRNGNVYTADPVSGFVYFIGALSSWIGDALYFFASWDYVDGYYTVPTYDVYVTYWDDSSVISYDYDLAYTEVWEYEEYFESTEFTQEIVEVEYSDETWSEESVEIESSSESRSETTGTEDSTYEEVAVDESEGDDQNEAGATDEDESDSSDASDSDDESDSNDDSDSDDEADNNDASDQDDDSADMDDSEGMDESDDSDDSSMQDDSEDDDSGSADDSADEDYSGDDDSGADDDSGDSY